MQESAACKHFLIIDFKRWQTRPCGRGGQRIGGGCEPCLDLRNQGMFEVAPFDLPHAQRDQGDFNNHSGDKRDQKA